ncbi:MAG: sulfite exporter TauE/SafE family protein [Pseudomonadota bacterium]
MSTTLAFSALLMGLAGGPHCVAMCGAACGAITRPGDRSGAQAPGDASGGAQVVSHLVVFAAPRLARNAALQRAVLFQVGRLAGYSAAGAAAAGAVQSLAWLTSNAAALRPIWMFFHLAVLAWGLALLVLARQPMWAGRAGRLAWTRVRPLASRQGGVLVAGTLWALMPCGLLYSALLVASLSGGPLDGAVAMALFALGSGLSLTAAPWLFLRLREAGNGRFKDLGTRLAGLMLALVAIWALWSDMVHRVAVWCGLV